MFKHSAGDDLNGQLKFAADQGFTAWEDSGLKNRPVDLQKKIATAMEACGMEMGALVAVESYQDATFARKHRHNGNGCCGKSARASKWPSESAQDG
jgi:hydroxypyruvate isomerase